MEFEVGDLVTIKTGIFAGWAARVMERMPEDITTYYVVEVDTGEDTYRYAKPENELEGQK